MKFKCEQPNHELPFGIEYSEDDDGLEILHVEWFATESERDAAFDAE